MSGSVLMYFQKVHDTLNLVILRIRTFKVSRGWEFDSPQELCFLDYYGRAHSLRHILAVWATSFVDPLTHTQAQPQLGWWMMWFAHTANNHILVQTCNHKIKNGEVLCYELSYSACIDCGALMRSNIRIQLCVTTRWPEVPALLSILTLVLRWLISSFFPDIIYPGFTKTSLFFIQAHAVATSTCMMMMMSLWWQSIIMAQPDWLNPSYDSHELISHCCTNKLVGNLISPTQAWLKPIGSSVSIAAWSCPSLRGRWPKGLRSWGSVIATRFSFFFGVHWI
jgi:hypothetical protein